MTKLAYKAEDVCLSVDLLDWWKNTKDIHTSASATQEVATISATIFSGVFMSEH